MLNGSSGNSHLRNRTAWLFCAHLASPGQKQTALTLRNGPKYRPSCNNSFGVGYQEKISSIPSALDTGLPRSSLCFAAAPLGVPFLLLCSHC